MPIDTLQFYYSQLSKSAQQNEIGENLLNDILTLSSKDDSFLSKYGSKNLSKQLKFAKGFFDFSLLDTNNNTFNLNNFKDRYTFVNFWASWCEPCIKNMQAYEKLKRDYLNQQINFVSISIDKSSANWKKSLRKNKITGINLIDSDGILESFYEIQGIPVYMIMKPDGNLADLEISKPGSPQLNKIIDTLLTKNPIKID
jgi:thiol-disulfide isomerase/thioredoxin